jgi:hypothetical protein
VGGPPVFVAAGGAGGRPGTPSGLGSGGAGGSGNSNGGVLIPGPNGFNGQCVDSGAGGAADVQGTKPSALSNGGAGGGQALVVGATGRPGSPGFGGYILVQW